MVHLRANAKMTLRKLFRGFLDQLVTDHSVSTALLCDLQTPLVYGMRFGLQRSRHSPGPYLDASPRKRCTLGGISATVDNQARANVNGHSGSVHTRRALPLAQRRQNKP